MEKMEKTYTKDDFINKFIIKAKEELGDVISYNNLYEALLDNKMYDEADEIEYIAQQEYHHARILMDILEEHDYDVDDDIDITNLCKKVKEIFSMS